MLFWIEGGRLRAFGPPAGILPAYRRSLAEVAARKCSGMAATGVAAEPASAAREDACSPSS